MIGLRLLQEKTPDNLLSLLFFSWVRPVKLMAGDRYATPFRFIGISLIFTIHPSMQYCFLFMTSTREDHFQRLPFGLPPYDLSYLTGQGPSELTSLLGRSFQVPNWILSGNLARNHDLCFDNFFQLPEDLLLISFVQNKCFCWLPIYSVPNVIMLC